MPTSRFQSPLLESVCIDQASQEILDLLLLARPRLRIDAVLESRCLDLIERDLAFKHRDRLRRLPACIALGEDRIVPAVFDQLGSRQECASAKIGRSEE